MIRAGLFLYDHLARRREVPGSASIPLRPLMRTHTTPQGEPQA